MRHCPHCGGVLKLDRVANLPDLVKLLALCRDCIDSGRPELARTVLHVIVEHRTNLGSRSRALARDLVEQMAEREHPKPDGD